MTVQFDCLDEKLILNDFLFKCEWANKKKESTKPKPVEVKSTEKIEWITVQNINGMKWNDRCVFVCVCVFCHFGKAPTITPFPSGMCIKMLSKSIFALKKWVREKEKNLVEFTMHLIRMPNGIFIVIQNCYHIH